MNGSRNWFRSSIKILLACLIVGWLLSALFDYQALDVVRDISRVIRALSEWILGIFRWALPFILLGAVVVVPIALIRYGWRLLKRRK